MENFGRDRAFNISPMKTAGEKGLIFSNHTDFNITPLDPMFTVWTAMKRESRSGVIIGPDERIDAYSALQALTTAPAWQFLTNTCNKGFYPQVNLALKINVTLK